MKLKVGEIKPNPFKNEINEGKLNKEQIEKITSNMDELGFFGALPVVKIKDKYHLVSGHHRAQALKKVYGNDYEVVVTVHEYNDDQLLRGMVVENLSQRGSEFSELLENLLAIRRHLEIRTDAGHISKTRPFESGSSADISRWLNKNGTIISLTKIKDTLRIYDKGHKSLVEKVKSGEIGTEAAAQITRIEDKNEQARLVSIISNSDVNGRVDDFVTKYLNADDTIKEKLLSKMISPENIDYEIAKNDFENKLYHPSDEISVIKDVDVVTELRSELKVLRVELDSFFFKMNIVEKKGYRWFAPATRKTFTDFVDYSLEWVKRSEKKLLDIKTKLMEEDINGN